MKVLFFDDAHTFGGAQIAAVNMARFIHENYGYDVSFYCSNKNERLIERLNQVNGIKILYDGYVAIPFFILTQFFFLWRVPFIVLRLRSLRPDIVIINMAGLEFGWLYIYAAKLLKLKFICWLHNPFLFTDLIQRKGWRHTMDVFRDRLANFFAKRIFNNLHTVSKSARDYLLKRLKKKSGINILGNTISLPEREEKSDINLARIAMQGFVASKVAVVPGRVSFGDKGQDKIISCLHELDKRSVAIIFIGDGGDLESLKLSCKGFRNVFFVAWQESVAKYIQGADVVLLPSRYETQGLIAMESMYLQVPVITSKIPAFLELMGDNFIADFDNPMELCNKIDWICSLSKSQIIAEYDERLQLCCGSGYKEYVLSILRGI